MRDFDSGTESCRGTWVDEFGRFFWVKWSGTTGTTEDLKGTARDAARAVEDTNEVWSLGFESYTKSENYREWDCAVTHML